MLTTRVKITMSPSGIWSGLLVWVTGYRFVSGLTEFECRARARVVAEAIGRQVEWL